MLTKDPKKRVNVENALKHPWIMKFIGRLDPAAEKVFMKLSSKHLMLGVPEE